MTHELRFQVLTIPNASWSEVLERFGKVEALGFDLVGMVDHFVNWATPSTP